VNPGASPWSTLNGSSRQILEEWRMGNVVVDISMSLDGFIAGPAVA
jgi:hypothetical protein